jgi:hypothetical protein
MLHRLSCAAYCVLAATNAVLVEYSGRKTVTRMKLWAFAADR